MKILITAPKTRYTEIFQSISLLFSFVTKKEDTYTQLFSPVKCRDFLGDVVWSKKTGQAVNIYGFNYDYKQAPFDNDMLRMSLTFPNEETKINFVKNFPFLGEKQIQSATSAPHFFLTNDPLSIIIEADPIWQSAQWKLSLFTYYLKLMCYPDVNKPKDPEDKYAAILTPEIESKLLSQIHREEDFISSNIHEAHNYSGFVSIIKCSSFFDSIKKMNQLLLGE